MQMSTNVCASGDVQVYPAVLILFVRFCFLHVDVHGFKGNGIGKTEAARSLLQTMGFGLFFCQQLVDFVVCFKPLRNERRIETGQFFIQGPSSLVC